MRTLAGSWWGVQRMGGGRKGSQMRDARAESSHFHYSTLSQEKYTFPSLTCLHPSLPWQTSSFWSKFWQQAPSRHTKVRCERRTNNDCLDECMVMTYCLCLCFWSVSLLFMKIGKKKRWSVRLYTSVKVGSRPINPLKTKAAKEIRDYINNFQLLLIKMHLR